MKYVEQNKLQNNIFFSWGNDFTSITHKFKNLVSLRYCIQGYFRHVIFTLHHLHTVLPWLEFAPTKLCLKRKNMSIVIRPVLNLPSDNGGLRSKNKTGEYFPLCSNWSFKSMMVMYEIKKEDVKMKYMYAIS